MNPNGKAASDKDASKLNNRNNRIRACIALVLAIATFFVCSSGTFTTLDNTFFDLMYQDEGVLNTDIRIVTIDDKTIYKHGAYNAFTYRPLFAQLLNSLADNGCAPKVIGFDIIFDALSDETDIPFGNAISRLDNVVLGTHNSDQTTEDTNYLLAPVLYKAAGHTGFCDAIVDEDNCVRRLTLQNDVLYSFAYEMHRLYCIEEGIEPYNDLPLSQINYFEYTSAKSGYTTIPLSDLLDGTVPLTALRDKIVFVGAYATGLAGSMTDDIYTCPISGDGIQRSEVFGVDIQANIFQALCDGRIYAPAEGIGYALASALLMLVIALLCFGSNLMLSIIALIAAIGLDAGVIIFMHGRHIYYPNASFIIMIIIAFILMMFFHYFLETRKKKKILGTFKRYISPDVADALVSDNEQQLTLGGARRDIACLFVDVRGFTKLSEELEPEQIVEILNEYLGVATAQVFKYGGMLDKFIGDAVMAIFNAPIDQDDYVYKAVCTAYGIVSEGQTIADKVFEKYGKRLRFGIGVHVGPAVVGNIGCDVRMDYTAIGDTVNTASRLESNAEGNQILISEDVYQLVKDRIKAEFVGEKMFKNKKDAIRCYQVMEVNN